MPGEMGVAFDTSGCQISVGDTKDTADVDEHAGATLRLLASSLEVL